MKIKIPVLVLIFAGWSLAVSSQVITTDPVFALASAPVVITFHADRGDMGMKDYTGDDVYAHTGVITNLSSGQSDWKYVVSGTWSTTVPPPDKVKLTRVDANTYTLTISPSIRAFYGVPESETIQKMAFVFRNGNARIPAVTTMVRIFSTTSRWKAVMKSCFHNLPFILPW